MFNQFGAVFIFILLGAAFVFGSLLFGYFVRRQKPNADKTAVYECGEPTVGSPWIRYNARFYNVALVYLLFDIEVVLLIPFALVYRDLVDLRAATVALIGLVVFFVLLFIGLAYEWYYGNLDWIRHDEQRTTSLK